MQADFRKLFDDHCWAETGLGPRKSWPGAIVQATECLLSSTEPMFLFVGDEPALLFNQPFAAMLGEDWGKVLGAPLLSVSGPNWSSFKPLVTRAMKGEAFLAPDLHFKTWMSGFTEERHYIASFTPVRDKDGTVLATWGICLKQSEDIRSVRNLRAQRDLLFSLLADSPTFALATEGDEHRIIFANPAFETITKRKIRVGSLLRDTFPEAERQELLAIYDDVLHKGRSFHFRNREFEIEQADGAGTIVKNVDIIYTPIRGNEGHIAGVFVQGHDNSPVVAARQRIDELERELIATDRIHAVEAFGSSLAHELNQPLATIANYARVAEMLLAKNHPGDGSLKICVKGISAAANCAGSVVRSMRALVQRASAKHEVFAVRDAAEAAIGMVNLSIDGRFLAAVDIDPALQAQGDRVLVEQVFINLLRNACEATGSEVTISLAAQRSGDLIKVSVEDDGPGFEDDGLRGLFRPLHDKKKEGLGLGLPICRTIVEALGGELAIRTARDQGASVSFTIPAAPTRGDPSVIGKD